MQICVQTLWCCLQPVWTLPLTKVCSIILRARVVRSSTSSVNWASAFVSYHACNNCMLLPFLCALDLADKMRLRCGRQRGNAYSCRFGKKNEFWPKLEPPMDQNPESAPSNDCFVLSHAVSSCMQLLRLVSASELFMGNKKGGSIGSNQVCFLWTGFFCFLPLKLKPARYAASKAFCRTEGLPSSQMFWGV